MLCLTLVSDIFGGIPRWCAGIAGWCAAFLLITKLKLTQRLQIAVIALIGVILLIVGARQNDPIDLAGNALAGGKWAGVNWAAIDWQGAIGNNAGLVSMLASVGFLRLIALPATQSTNVPLPVGFNAFVKTLTGVSLFGSVINISAAVLFADRLYDNKALGRLASQSITRVFTATAAWSPFFGGMAAVLTYVPDMRLKFVVAACIPFAVVGFVVVVSEATWRHREAVRSFRGYPVNFYNLWIPAALAIIILFLAQVAETWSVLTHISLSALSLTLFVLLWRQGPKSTLHTIGRFIVEGLPAMVNELHLFLAAGVLAAGLASVISGAIIPTLSAFTAFEAMMLLGAMILLAIAGVHPVVTLAGATPLIMTLQPHPDLLAVCFLLAWSLGTCVSPLSGTHLIFQGRYGIPSWKGALWNWPYVAFMYCVAAMLMFVIDRILRSGA